MILTDNLRTAMANTFQMYYRAYSCYWNSQGIHFYSVRLFLKEMYTDLWETVNGLAEQIKSLDTTVPPSISGLLTFSTIECDQSSRNQPVDILKGLLDANTQVISSLELSLESSRETNTHNVTHYLEERLANHARYNWMIKATLHGIKK